MPVTTLTTDKVSQISSTRTTDKRRLQILVSPEAYRRINIAAADRNGDKGSVIGELALLHLPPAPDTTGRRNQ